jgi:hypothetical protein
MHGKSADTATKMLMQRLTRTRELLCSPLTASQRRKFDQVLICVCGGAFGMTALACE